MTSVFVICVAVLNQTGIPKDAGRIEVITGSDQTPIEVFTYRPAEYRDGPLLIVCHGVLRNAEEYRNDAMAMGARFGALIAAPHFDAERFPFEKYQWGGIGQEGQAVPARQATFSRIPEIVDEIRRREGRPDLPYYLIGHSAGGQFVERLAGFLDSGAVRIVATNPGTHLVPTRDQPFPFGFGGLPDELSDDRALQRYLAQPLTIYLGTGDVESDEYLDRSPAGMRQGACRLARGRYTYEFARRLAQERGWTFRWRLVEAPGISHDHERMFDHAEAGAALFGSTLTPGK